MSELTEARLEAIRQWLQEHRDFDLTIDPCGLKRLWTVQLSTRGCIRKTWGPNLHDRLSDVESWIHAIDCGAGLADV